MGGRGGRSGSGANRRTATNSTLSQRVTNQANNPVPNIQNQVPTPQNTPVASSADIYADLAAMTDAQLAQVYRDSQRTSLPNHLNDNPDVTQKFVYSIGLNERPMVLDAASFNQFMSDNNIPQSQLLARSVNGGVVTTTAGNRVGITAQDILDQMKYSRLNYIGGKHGGQAYGAGTYFDMTGGRNTGYGQTTAVAVLNPATARVITDAQLSRMAHAFDQSHPQFARATGGYNTGYSGGRNNMSVYAVVMGYNVIKDAHGTYHNVIDRAALTYRQ